MTTSQILVEYLIVEGIPYVLGMFGHGNVQFGEALAERQDEITYIQVKNEQNAVHIAAAYAKMTGKPLAVTTSIGPGCTNMVTGAAGAKINRLPVLLLPGDAFIDGVGPILQQIEGNSDVENMASSCLKPVSKYWARISTPKQLMRRLPEAFNAMLEPGNQGPATLCLPMDVQAEAYDYDLDTLLAPRDEEWERISPDPRAIERAVDLIKNSKRPFIIAGGGVIRSQAWDEVIELAEHICAPVAQTHNGNGTMLWDHPLNLFGTGVHGTSCGINIAEKADLIIGIGTRYQDFPVASETLFSKKTQFININIFHTDIGKKRAVKVYGDAKIALGMMFDVLKQDEKDGRFHPPKHGNVYFKEIQAGREEWLNESDRLRNLECSPMAQSEVIGILNDFVDENAVVVSAAGSLPGDLLKLWRCRDITRKGYHVEFGNSCMGYEIPAGLGVKLADPSRDVYVMVGDASFLMAHQEIVTMVQEGIAVTIIVVDNHGPQCIRYLQHGSAFKEFGNEFRFRKDGKLTGEHLNIDFAKIAQGMGAVGIKTGTKNDLFKALKRAKNIDNRPVLIHVPIHHEISVPGYGAFWNIPIPEVSDRPELQKQLESYRAKMKTQVIR